MKLDDFLIQAVCDADNSITSRALIHKASTYYASPPQKVKAVLKVLIDSNVLGYISKNGHTYIEPSLNSARKITEHFTLAPPRTKFVDVQNYKVIIIEPGSSFGLGNHPTTRLSLMGIEFMAHHYLELFNGSVLDVGCGNGILAIGCAKLGYKKSCWD